MRRSWKGLGSGPGYPSVDSSRLVVLSTTAKGGRPAKPPTTQRGIQPTQPSNPATHNGWFEVDMEVPLVREKIRVRASHASCVLARRPLWTRIQTPPPPPPLFRDRSRACPRACVRVHLIERLFDAPMFGRPSTYPHLNVAGGLICMSPVCFWLVYVPLGWGGIQSIDGLRLFDVLWSGLDVGCVDGVQQRVRIGPSLSPLCMWVGRYKQEPRDSFPSNPGIRIGSPSA